MSPTIQFTDVVDGCRPRVAERPAGQLRRSRAGRMPARSRARSCAGHGRPRRRPRSAPRAVGQSRPPRTRRRARNRVAVVAVVVPPPGRGYHLSLIQASRHSARPPRRPHAHLADAPDPAKRRPGLRGRPAQPCAPAYRRRERRARTPTPLGRLADRTHTSQTPRTLRSGGQVCEGGATTPDAHPTRGGTPPAASNDAAGGIKLTRRHPPPAERPGTASPRRRGRRAPGPVRRSRRRPGPPSAG